MELAIFSLLALVAVAAAIGVIVQSSAVRSALFLLLNFCSLAGLYILLNAQFVAVVQIIIYAGAVVVLFLFVVMLLGMEDPPSGISDSEPAAQNPAPGSSQKGTRLGAGAFPAEARISNATLLWIAAALLGALLLAGLVWAFVPSLAGEAASATAAVSPGSTVQQIGTALLTSYAIPFELTSLVLLIAMIGAVVLAKRRREG